MRKILIWAAIFFLLGKGDGLKGQNSESLASELSLVISGLKGALERMDEEAYVSYYSLDNREKERQAFNYFLHQKKIETVKVYPSLPKIDDFRAEIKLKILFIQATSVIIDIWNLHFQRRDGQWWVTGKEISPERRVLYRLKIPGNKVEQAKRVEITHVDLKLVFTDAVCFYDNLPQMETALLIIGQGEIEFAPKVKNERHHLKLMFGQEQITDKLKYAYLRFSPSFYNRNIKIEGINDHWSPSKSLLNKAYSLFVRHYSRSFAVENSLMNEFLSFIPQGEEVVFEFEGEKKGIMTYVFSPFAEEEINFFQWRDDRIVSLYSPEAEKGLKRMFVSFGHMFDVEAYQIEIDYNPNKYYLSGKARIEIAPQVDSLDSLKFKFHPNLEILKVYDQNKNELFFNRDRLRKVFYVYLLEPEEKGQSFYVDVYYRGEIKPEQLTSDVLYFPQYEEEVIFIQPRYETYLFSQSSYWYPSPPNDDYFQVELRAVFPPEYQCIANGEQVDQGELKMSERVEELEKIGFHYCNFKTRYPVKYISFIVGKFTNRGKKEGNIPTAYYQASDTGVYHREWLAEAEQIVDFYSRWFGDYPYEKLYLVQRLWPQKGGHSPASFVILNELPRIPGRLRFSKVSSPVDLSRWKGYFLAHEIAHQWWGQALSWDTYHDQWLSEGLAQLAAVLYLEKKYGQKAYRQIIENMTNTINKNSKVGPITMGSRLSFIDFAAYQSIVYNKTALVLLMIKDIIGEELFFDRLRSFFCDYKYKAARTGDFFRYLSSGRHSFSLASQFKQKWFDDHRLPVVYVYYSIQENKNPMELIVEVTQGQYWFPFPLRIEWEEEGRKVSKQINVTERFLKLALPLTQVPKKIKFNPWQEIPGKFYIKKVA
ncbi:MAG TPA: hypothetical protein ENF17_01525 [Candidatus Aminicenantes bacterium]|nr:hypothetical protein [Candidatus Aminicenantes bacterium]